MIIANTDVLHKYKAPQCQLCVRAGFNLKYPDSKFLPSALYDIAYTNKFCPLCP